MTAGRSCVTKQKIPNEKKRTADAVLFPYGGAYEDRTHDLQIANLALSQLS